MKLAFETGERKKLKTLFHQNTKTNGKERFSGFLQCHPKFSLRQPQSTLLLASF
jgi:hypothetical protein